MIRVKHFDTSDINAETAIHVFIEGTAEVNAFKDLIQRGAQTWADAPASMKTVADLITSKMQMQPYEKMSGEKK